MLRRGLAALMMGVICAGSVTADDAVRSQDSVPRAGLATWFKQRLTRSDRQPAEASSSRSGRVTLAVVNDAEEQGSKSHIRRVSAQSSDDVVVVSPTSTVPALKPIEQAPVMPNTSSVTGPQYFSAVPNGGLSNPVPVYPANNWQQYAAPVPVQAANPGYYTPVSNPNAAGPVVMGQQGTMTGVGGGAFGGGGYPQTGAALYPSPVPGIPQQIGGTIIPNQAFHPHEMLYAHQYRAMYPPYYYKVNGGWMVTPFGVWSHEDWKLQGTMVEVKYKSSISPFALYKRPARSH